MRPGFTKVVWALVALALLSAAVLRWVTPATPRGNVGQLTVYDTSPAPLKLAAIYHGSTSVPISTAQSFRAAFEPLRHRCIEDDARISDVLVSASNFLAQKGRARDLLTLMRGLGRAIPDGAGKVSCADTMSAVIVLMGA